MPKVVLFMDEMNHPGLLCIPIRLVFSGPLDVLFHEIQISRGQKLQKNLGSPFSMIISLYLWLFPTARCHYPVTLYDSCWSQVDRVLINLEAYTDSRGTFSMSWPSTLTLATCTKSWLLTLSVPCSCIFGLMVLSGSESTSSPGSKKFMSHFKVARKYKGSHLYFLRDGMLRAMGKIDRMINCQTNEYCLW